jgi:hypothetical protein
MNQHGAVAKQITFIQGLAVRACELRLERHTRDVSGKEQVEYICGASGGFEHGHVLGVVGEMSAICNTCPIPDALEARQSCLNLVPVRRFSGGKRILPNERTSLSFARCETCPMTRAVDQEKNYAARRVPTNDPL